jgi:hypothetical protein
MLVAHKVALLKGGLLLGPPVASGVSVPGQVSRPCSGVMAQAHGGITPSLSEPHTHTPEVVQALLKPLLLAVVRDGRCARGAARDERKHSCRRCCPHAQPVLQQKQSVAGAASGASGREYMENKLNLI